MLHIALCDDHPVVREGMRGMLSREPDMRVEVDVGTGAGLLREVEGKRLDVIVLDISLPDMNGLEVLKTLQASGQKAGVLVLSMHPEEHYAVRALKAGAAGYLQKESVPEQLVAAVRRIARGKRYVTESLAERLAVDVGRGADRPPHELLSDREQQVLCLLASGKGIKEIAAGLCVSATTVATYRARLMAKLSFSSTADIVRYALENGLIQ